MLRTASAAALASALAASVACGGDEATSPDSPLGRYELGYASGVRVTADVKDVPSQQWMVYSGGWLVLRADSTYEMQIDGRVRDSGSPINGRHSGTFHWTRKTGAIDLRASNGQSSEYRGTATVDSVAVYCWFSGSPSARYPSRTRRRTSRSCDVVTDDTGVGPAPPETVALWVKRVQTNLTTSSAARSRRGTARR
jgi:hypothetical protein